LEKSLFLNIFVVSFRITYLLGDITHKVHHIHYINHIKKSPEFQLPLYFLSISLKIKIIFVQIVIIFLCFLFFAQFNRFLFVYFALMVFVQLAQATLTVM